MSYDEGSTPRTLVSGRVYTSTEYPPEHRIPLHSEMAYSHRWPQALWFWCDTPAERGGATLLAHNRKVLEQLSPRLREAFRARGVMYVRNFGEHLDVPWQRAFHTADRGEVARYCEDAGIECEWRGDSALRTRQVRHVFAAHPRTGEELWFNQAHLFQVSSLAPEIREGLAAIREENLPRHAYYGDGSQIPDRDVCAIKAAFDACAVEHAWRPGDLLLVDNMLVAHGRDRFHGHRRVLVAMSRPHGAPAGAMGPSQP